LEVTIKGKNVDVSDDLELYTERKAAKLEKLSKRLQAITITFVQNASKRNDKAYRVEVVLHAPGQVMRSQEEEASFHIAVDSAMDKLRRQLKRLKTKRADKLREKISKAQAALSDITPVVIEETEDETPEVFVQHFATKPMTTNEAVMMLEASGDELLVFINDLAITNCLRRRPEGGYTLYVPGDEQA